MYRFFSGSRALASPLPGGPIFIDEIPNAGFVRLQRRRPIEGEPAQHIGKGLNVHGRNYGTLTGTTLMLLNGEPLIRFVLITVYTSTFFSVSTARWI